MRSSDMPINETDAERMLKEEDCLFTREHLEECRKDNRIPLFTWGGVDFFLSIMLQASTKKK